MSEANRTRKMSEQDYLMDLIVKFPHMRRLPNNIFCYNNEGINLYVMFRVPNFPRAKNAMFRTEFELPKPKRQLLAEKSENMWFIDYMTLFMSCITTEAMPKQFNNYNFERFYAQMMNLKQTYGTEAVKFFFDEDVSNFKMTYTQSNITHSVSVNVDFYNTNDNLNLMVQHHSFPNRDNMFQIEQSLEDLFNRFKRIIDLLHPFYTALHEIDTTCWVLDPVVQTGNANYRRIMIDKDVSMVVTFDPWNMLNPQRATFFGPNKSIRKYIRRYDIEKWNNGMY